VNSFPKPDENLEGFLSALDAEGAAKKTSDIPYTWDPIDRKVKPWIDSKKAMKKYKGGKCTIA
jgi:hypothetical protein